MNWFLIFFFQNSLYDYNIPFFYFWWCLLTTRHLDFNMPDLCTRKKHWKFISHLVIRSFFYLLIRVHWTVMVRFCSLHTGKYMYFWCSLKEMGFCIFVVPVRLAGVMMGKYAMALITFMHKRFWDEFFFIVKIFLW